MEEAYMSEGYKIISEFKCYGNKMVIVRIGNAAHVIDKAEWLRICGFNRTIKNLKAS